MTLWRALPAAKGSGLFREAGALSLESQKEVQCLRRLRGGTVLDEQVSRDTVCSTLANMKTPATSVAIAAGNWRGNRVVSVVKRTSAGCKPAESRKEAVARPSCALTEESAPPIGQGAGRCETTGSEDGSCEE